MLRDTVYIIEISAIIIKVTQTGLPLIYARCRLDAFVVLSRFYDAVSQ